MPEKKVYKSSTHFGVVRLIVKKALILSFEQSCQTAAKTAEHVSVAINSPDQIDALIAEFASFAHTFAH